MLLWFKDFMKVNEKLQLKDPTFRHFCLVPLYIYIYIYIYIYMGVCVCVIDIAFM